MKKAIVISFLLMFGLVFQTQAVSTNANQGTKSQGTGTGQTVPQAQGNQGVGNTVSTQEKNQVKNQGESTQIQTQEQNAVQTQDGAQNNTNSGKSNSTSNPSVQKRSQVANAVQAMLQIADRNGGIGQQVRVIAQNQTQNQAKLQQNLDNVEGRGGFIKFFMGPNYGEIKNAEATLAQNREQIQQLSQIRTQLQNQNDQKQLTEQIRILEQANLEIENSLTEAQSGFSLFGWLNKLFS